MSEEDELVVNVVEVDEIAVDVSPDDITVEVAG